MTADWNLLDLMKLLLSRCLVLTAGPPKPLLHTSAVTTIKCFLSSCVILLQSEIKCFFRPMLHTSAVTTIKRFLSSCVPLLQLVFSQIKCFLSSIIPLLQSVVSPIKCFCRPMLHTSPAVSRGWTLACSNAASNNAAWSKIPERTNRRHLDLAAERRETIQWWVLSSARHQGYLSPLSLQHSERLSLDEAMIDLVLMLPHIIDQLKFICCPVFSDLVV